MRIAFWSYSSVDGSIPLHNDVAMIKQSNHSHYTTKLLLNIFVVDRDGL